MVRSDPVDDRRAVVLRFDRISQQGMFETLPQRLDDEVGGLEIHIRDPCGQQVRAAEMGLQSIVFHGARSAALDDSVEIVGLHDGILFKSLYGLYSSALLWSARAGASPREGHHEAPLNVPYYKVVYRPNFYSSPSSCEAAV